MAANLDLALRIQAATTGLQDIASLIGEIKSLGGETAGLDEELIRLNKDLSTLQNQQNLLTQFRAVEQKVVDTSAAFEKARAKARDLAAQLTATGEPSTELISAFKSATTQAESLQRSLIRQRDSLEQQRTALKAAGIETKDLAGEQKRLDAQLGDVSAQIKKQTADLQSAKAAQQQYNATLEETKRTAGGLGDSLKNLLIGVGIEEAIRRTTALADQYTMLAGRLKLAVEGQGDFGQAMADVNRIAQETFSGLEGIGTLYEKLTRQASALSLSQQSIADITSVVAKGLKLGGASAQESSSAILQLGQALGSGVLRGEEFNAVFEASPYIMQQLADGIGVPLGALRSLAEQGQLTADTVVKSFLRQKDTIDEAFGKLPLTVGNAFQALTTSFQSYVGEADKGLGVTTAIANGIKFLSDNVGALDSIFAGAAVGGIAKLILSLEGVVGSAAAATTGMTLLQRAVAILGSPLGLGAVAVGVAALISYFGSAGKSAKDLSADLDQTIKNVDRLTLAQLRGAELGAKAAVAAAQDQVKASEDRIKALKKEISLVDDNINSQDRSKRSYANMASSLEFVQKMRENLTAEEAKAVDSAEGLAKAQDNLAIIQDRITKGGKAHIAIAEAQGESYIKQVDNLKKLTDATELQSGLLEKEQATLAAVTAVREQLIGSLGTETSKREAQIALEKEQVSVATKIADAKQKEIAIARQSLSVTEQELAKRNELIPVKQKELDLAKWEADSKKAILAITLDQIRVVDSLRDAQGNLSNANEKTLKQLEALATSQESQVLLAEKSVLAKEREVQTISELLPQQQKQLDTAKETVAAKNAEAIAAETNVRALELETAALQGTVEGHRLAGQAIQLTVTQLSELGRMSTQATQGVVALQQAQLEGRATQEQVNAAQQVAVEIMTAYKVALEDTLKRIDERIAATGRHTEAIKTEYDVQLAQNQALIAGAKARSDDVAQINLGVEAKRIEAAQAAAVASALQSELGVLRERLAVQQQQAAADKEITVAEQAQLQATQDGITAKQAAIEISKAHADALASEAIAARNSADAIIASNDAMTLRNAAITSSADALRTTSGAITQQAGAYDQLTASAKAALEQQIALSLGSTDLTGRINAIQRYNAEVDKSAKLEAAFAAEVADAAESVKGSGAEAVLAAQRLNTLSYEGVAFGDVITKAGQQAIATLQQFRQESEDAVTSLRDLIARANGDLLAQEQLQHEANLRRIADLAKTSADAEALQDDAERAEKERHDREIARIKESSEKKKGALSEEKVAVEKVADTYTAIADASAQSSTATAKNTSALVASLSQLDTVSLDTFTGKLDDIDRRLVNLTVRANELRAAL